MTRKYKKGNCSICGRYGTLNKNKTCSKHYSQMKKYGKYLDDNSRFQTDPNEIIMHNDYAEIILYDKLGYEAKRSKIDLDDIDKVKNIKWSLGSGGYVRGNIKGKNYPLHRYIMPCDKKEVVDHINRDRLDNRKSNLRICNTIENNRNLSMAKNNKSCVTGVCWRENKKVWRAYITYNSKNIELGAFDKFCDAVECRWKYERRLFGEFSPNK
jgi:hypothetical protein